MVGVMLNAAIHSILQTLKQAGKKGNRPDFGTLASQTVISGNVGAFDSPV